MKKTLGIFVLLVVVFLLTATMSESFLSPFNLENLLRRTALFGIISIGVAFVIITGGIDLSIGSVICLVGCGLPFCLQVSYLPMHQSDVAQISASDGSVTLAQSLSEIEQGDHVRLFNSDPENTGIYEVISVSDNRTLSLRPSPQVNSQLGSLVKMYPVVERSAEGNSVNVPEARLKKRDRLGFFADDGKVGETARIISVSDTGNVELDVVPSGDYHYAVAFKRSPKMSVPVALGLVVLVSVGIGLTHGWMIAKLKLQPFVVTLCGLLFYRGITRGFTEDQAQGLKDEYPILRLFATAEIGSVDIAQALGGLGLVLFLVGLGFFLRQRKRKANDAGWVPTVAMGLGMLITVGGLYTKVHKPVIPVVASETASMAVNLSEGARKITLEARGGNSGWTFLEDYDVSAMGENQALNIPALSDIRARMPGDWNEVRIIVQERELATIGIPAPCIILIVVTVIAAVFLNRTIYGRYLLALGRNEEAARYSGINTERMIILAYVICSVCAGLGGVLFILDVNSAQPVDFGNFYELYAIAAAVLGGCSLRGGEGAIIGVVVGAALMRVLKNTITLVDWIPTHIEFAIIGAVILIGVAADEVVKRFTAKRRAAMQISKTRESAE